ncbi:hypothetical protein [Trichormus sp. NMC-1]|uniref:hypothetical protein n=1 Tax=Trichormus sp. NMC-1 TaxID=1853259 RepID=UPI0008DC27EA|nr:hypothetical protein [Trichormus sp. NMC-1]
MKYKIKSAFQKFANTAITLSGVMTAAGITLSAQSAQALNISFSTTNFSQVTGVVKNNASPSTVINTQASPNGFGNVFTSNFLLIGANTTNANIPNDSLVNNNSDARSNIFAVSAADAAQPITMTFNWAFNGNATGVTNDADSFLIRIIGPTSRTFFQRTTDPNDTIPGYGSGINEIATVTPLGTAGNYRIQISLNENLSTNSSAAGFNNINISSTPVPFGFSTNMSLLVFGGMFYGMNKLKKKMAVKKFQA